MGIVRRHVQSKVDWKSISALEQIGLDEISLKKGHKDFVTVVSAYIGGRVQLLAVLEDRKKDTVKDFLETIPEDLKKTIKSVCYDMYDGFINAAKEAFGSLIRIVVVSFHVAKQYRKGFDTLRIQELKRLKKELTEKEYAFIERSHVGVKKEKERLDYRAQSVIKTAIRILTFVRNRLSITK